MGTGIVRRPIALAVMVGLAMTAIVGLSACGDATVSAMPVASAPAAVFDPPRPSGLTDKIWTEWVSQLDPAGARARFAARTPEDQSKVCKAPYPIPTDTLSESAINRAKQYPGSTAEEWSAFFSYYVAANKAYGLAGIRDELCATVTAPAQ